ncbi:hypothetical protein MP638_004190, partial [Amoeboaphelidium occidentale]
MQEYSAGVWSVAIYKDSLLLTSSNDIVQKDIQTGDIQRTFRAHKKPIVSFVVTNDSRMISSAYDDMIIFWDLETGSILKRIWLRSSGTLIRHMYYQSELVFAGGLDSKVRQIDLESGRVVRTISFTGKVLCVLAEKDYLYVGKDLPSFGVKLEIKTGAIILSLNGHSGGIFSFFLWDSLLFSGSINPAIICWNTENGEIIQ